MILKGKKVTVIGLGKSGFAAAKFLLGKKAEVRVTDSSQKKEVLEAASYLRGLSAQVETGGHTEAFVLGSDWVVKSPGVPENSLPLLIARRKNIPVIGEVELAGFFCPGPIVAVTGSNGKTTTSHLIHRLLTDAGRKSILCGNVGYSFLSAVAEMDRNTVAVVELSSFQLEDVTDFKPDVAVVLNISPNHLDRHKTMRNYARAKERIFRNQTAKNALILNYDDPRTRAMAKSARSRVFFYGKKPLRSGFFLKGGRMLQKDAGREKPLIELRDLGLKGEHNLENMLAAVAAATLFKIDKDSMQKTLNAFRTLEHRIEPLGSVAGVHFVNDSKSTTVDSTLAAIRSLSGGVVLIAGGRDKGASFSQMDGLLKERVKAAVLYGEAREKIAGSWKGFRRRCALVERFPDAVRRAFESAGAGDTVLLSPMCTSFDQFSSFEERGEAFKKIFEELKSRSAA